MEANSVVVGSDACPILKVYSILKNSQSFPIFHDQWQNIARDLQVSGVRVKKWKDDFHNLNKIQLTDLVYEIIEEWVTNKGSDATHKELIDILERNGLRIFTKPLEDEFLQKGISIEEDTIRKYSRLPIHLQKFIDQKKRNKSCCVLSTIDVEITSDKVRELCGDRLFKEFDNALDMLSNPNASTEPPIFVVLSSTKEFKQLLAAVTNTKVSQVQRLVAIIHEEIGKSVQNIVGKHSSWKKTVEICSDLMEWDDLTPSFKSQLEERLQLAMKTEIADEGLSRSLQGQTLVDLIKGQEIKLFKETIPTELPYYISRTILKRNYISDAFWDEKSSDIFLISGLERYELSVKVKNATTDHSSSQIKQKELTSKHILLDHEDNFSKICAKTCEPVHWLIYENGNFTWRKSRGEVKTLQKYLETRQDLLSEEDFFATLKTDCRVPICISDGPGMGKSVLLARIANKLSQAFPDRTVIFTSMRDFIKHIKIMRIKDRKIAIMETLKNLACANEFGKSFLESKFYAKDTDWIELLFDGFDELDSGDLPLAHDVLQRLKSSFCSVRLWVSSRPHLLTQLENTLSTLSFHLEPLGFENQVHFLSSYWALLEHEVDTEKLKLFAGHCLDSIKFKMQTQYHDIAGVPLQCRMIAEIYEKDALEYSRFENQSPLPTQPELGSITELYQLSIKHKIQKYKLTYDKVELKEEQLMQFHARLSLGELFPNHLQMLDVVLPKSDKMQEIFKIGILESSRSSSSHVRETGKFIHQTFAEYFLAWFVLHTLTKAESFWMRLLRKTVSRSKLSYTRKLIDFIFCAILGCAPEFVLGDDGTRYYEQGYFHFNYPVVIYFLDSLIADVPSTPVTFISRHLNSPNYGQTMLEIAHSCATHDFINIFNFLRGMKVFDKHEEVIFDEIFAITAIRKSGVPLIKIAIDYLENYNVFESWIKADAVQEAVSRGEFSIFEYLINKRQLRVLVENFDVRTIELLHDCVKDTHSCSPTEVIQRIQILGMLAKINPDLLEIMDGEGKTPILANHVHLQLLRKLIALGANVLVQTSVGSNVLHCSNHLSDAEYQTLIFEIPEDSLTKLVRQKGRESMYIRITDSVNLDPIHQNVDPVGIHVSIKNDYQENALAHVISRGRSIETISRLVECGANVGWKGKQMETLLHVAAKLGRVKITMFLIDHHGFDVNVENVGGLTPMDYVLQASHIQGNRIETGLELRRRGGRFKETIDIQGRTWLHFAALIENLHSLQLLLQLELDMDVADVNGDTALHFGVKFGEYRCNYFYITKHLLDKNANPNLINMDGETPFHSLLRNRFADFRTFQLLKSVTDVNWTTTLATLALHFIICTTNHIPDESFCSLMDELENWRPDFTNTDESGNSLLHNALEFGHQRAVQYLVENRFANLNLRNGKGYTPLHTAAISKHVSSKIIIYLIEHGADVYGKTDDDNTFLHLYTSLGLHSHITELHSLVEYLVDKNHSNLFDTPGADPTGVTPLQLALWHLNPDESTLFILRSNNVNFGASDRVGNNSLAYAILGKQSPKLLSALINKFGVNPKKHSKKRESLLHIASLYGTAEALEFILELGVLPVNGKDTEGNTPLHYVLLHSSIEENDNEVLEKCELLVENEAGVNSLNLNRQTPIHVAAMNKDKQLSFDVICYLVENGGDLLATDDTSCNFLHYLFSKVNSFSPAQFHILVEYLASKNACGLFNWTKADGCNPLMMALVFTEPFPETLRLLRTNDVNFNFVDKKGNSILVVAIYKRHRKKGISLLITEFGVDWKRLNDFESSLLHHSALYGNVEALKLLLSIGGINVNGADVEGDTALHYAVNSISIEDVEELCQLLVSNGAKVNLANKEGKTPLDFAKAKFAEEEKVYLMQMLRVKQLERKGQASQHLHKYIS